MQRILLFLQKHWIKFVVCILVGFGLMAIYNSAAGNWHTLASYSNGAFIGGAVLFLVGLLSLVGSFGAFDLASFYFLRKRVDETRKENYGEYVTRRADDHAKARMGFLPYVIVGILYIIAGIVTFYCIPTA